MAKKAAAGAARVHEPEILAPEHREAGLVQTDGTQVAGFLNNLVPFFRGALALEDESKRLEAHAKALAPPTTREEDEAVQAHIRASNAHIKAVEAHWSITTVFHGLHRKLTAGRARGTDPATSSASIAQRLHNRYVEEAERKARLEQDRIRREAEEQARRDREAELARLEAEALKAEEESADLSERERLFVDMVAREFSGHTAAKSAGYKNPDQAAAKLLGTAKIQDALKAKRDAAAIRQQATAVQAAPLVVEVEEVKPDISRGGGYDKAPWKATVTDERLLIEAILGGKHGIPTDILTVKQTKINDYAKALGDLMNRWPGVSVARERKTY